MEDDVIEALFNIFFITCKEENNEDDTIAINNIIYHCLEYLCFNPLNSMRIIDAISYIYTTEKEDIILLNG